MRYLKLYEEFEIPEVELDEPKVEEPKVDDDELSNYTIDDVLGGSLFSDDFEDEDEGSYIDHKGIIHIKNWNQY